MKKLNVFLIMMLLIGQTILGPIGAASASEIGESVTAQPEDEAAASAENDVTDVTDSEETDPESEGKDPETRPSDEESDVKETEKDQAPNEDEGDAPDNENAGTDQPTGEDEKPAVGEPDSEETINKSKEALQKAEAAVEVAEQSKTQEDIDAARALVDELETSEQKADLTTRLGEIIIAESDEDEVNTEKHGFNLALGAVTDLEGNPFTEENLLNPADEFKLRLEWNLTDGHNYIEGDKETFDLSKGIKITEEMNGELRDESNQLLATYTITKNKKVELTFTDFVEGHSTVKGWLETISTLDEQNVEVEDGEAIIEPIGEEGEIRIPIEEGSKEKTIEKSVKPLSYNANKIGWVVTINKNKTSLIDAKVTDILPAGTEYKEGSLKVIKLRVDLNGNILGDAGEVEVTGEAVDDGLLTIPLGDIKDAYRIEYVTNVTDDEEKNFRNEATLNDEELDDVKANATATINRGEAIKKKAAKGYNPKTGIIEWEIEFNYNQKKLEGVTLTDAWTPTGKMDLVEDSLAFQEVRIDENGRAHHEGNAVKLPGGATLKNVEDGFEVAAITTDNAYKITYQTKVKDRVLDPFNITNTAGFGTESDGTTGTYVGQYYGSKSAGTIDYAAKTIDWKIEINHDEYPMEKISITDTLGEGLTLLKDTVRVTVDGNEYKDFKLGEGNPFTIDFPDGFTTDKKIEISYKTEFEADKVPNHRPTNNAAITWTPKDGNESITKDIEAGTNLNEETKNNDWKNGSYDPATKEITWTIIANYRENAIGNLIVKDAPEGNQKILAGSVVVKELTIETGGNFVEGNPLDLIVATINEEANTMEVEIGNTEKAYKIEYKTSLAGLSDIQGEYENKAEVLDGTEKLSELAAKVGIAKSDTYGEKSGYQDGKQVHWSVKVNLGQQVIENLRLEDTISNNQEYLTDTFKVYHATVDGNGNAAKGEEVPSDQYELTHTPGEQFFTVKWNNKVERAFIVEYSTLFFAGHNENVTNGYKITGDNIIENGHVDGGGTVQIKQLSSGGGSGEAGYLVIDKFAQKDGVEAKLAGAKFDLIDPDTKKVLKSGTTDEDGQVDFGRLLFGTYELVEQAAPNGYLPLKDPINITINNKYTEGEKASITVERVENKELIYAVELLKVDKDKDENGDLIPLSGAEFTLYYADGTIVEDEDGNTLENLTTNEDGKIIVNDLEPGNYYFVETKAPNHYLLDENRILFEIEETNTAIAELIKENERGKGKLLIKKVDADEKDEDGNYTKALEGAVFELYGSLDDTKPFKTETSDANGIVDFGELPYDNYTLKEKTAPTGYVVNIDENTKEVLIDSKEEKEVIIENNKITRSVKLTKVDVNNHERLLQGAVFELRMKVGTISDQDGNEVPTYKVIENIDAANLTTDENGELFLENLEPGSYQFIEKTAPSGYRLDATPVKFEITENQTETKLVMKENRRRSSGGGGGGTPPAPSCDVFTLTVKVEGETLGADEEFTLRSEAKEVSGKTDANGKIVFDKENLPAGTYTAYDKNGTNVGTVTVTYAYNDCQAEVDLNPIAKACDVFTVTVKEQGETLGADVEFTLKSGKKEIVGKTDANGKIVFDQADLPEGTYTVYDQDGKDVGKITVMYTTGKCAAEIDLNPKACETFTLTVKDTPKADVALKDRNGNTVATGKTDANGVVVFDKPILEGKYSVYVQGEYVDQITATDSCTAMIDPEMPENPEQPGKPSEPGEPGEPGKPGDGMKDPEQPSKPSAPGGNDGAEDPKDPGASGTGGNTDPNQKVNSADKLPQTGEEHFIYMIACGILFLAAGGTMLFRQRKKA